MSIDRVSVTIPADLAAEVRQAARREHRSFSGQAAYFIQRALDDRREESDKVVASI